jgi:hypothetical protein
MGGAETWMVESAVWLDLDSGKNVGRVDQYALCYAVDPALTHIARFAPYFGVGPSVFSE